MCYENIYSKIKLWQKYLGTSIKVGCSTRNLYASSGPKVDGIPTNNQRGWDQDPVASKEVKTRRVI